MSHSPEHQVKQLVSRVNRIEGQIGGIRKMIVEEKPFDDILIQLNSVKSAVQKISQILLEAHADHSIQNVVNGTDAEKELESLRKAIKQYSKIL